MLMTLTRRHTNTRHVKDKFWNSYARRAAVGVRFPLTRPSRPPPSPEVGASERENILVGELVCVSDLSWFL